MGMRYLFWFLYTVLVIEVNAASPDFKSFRFINGVRGNTNGIGLNQLVTVDGSALQPASANLTNWSNLSTSVVSGAGGTGEVSTAQLLNASNVLRSAQSSGDASTLSSSINYTLVTSNSLFNSVGGGSGGGSVALAPTNIPSATAFTVNATWQVSCVSLAHNATVVVSNLSLGQVDAMLIVTNTGSFTMTFPQFGAGQWEDGVIPSLPANRTATVFFSRPTTGVTNIYMRGQDLLLAVDAPSTLGTNATSVIITNLLNVLTNNTFGAATLAGPVSELLFSNGITATISGRRATLGMDTAGGAGGSGSSSSVETNITADSTNNIVIDLDVANIFHVLVQTNWTYTISNRASLTRWESHLARVYWHQDTNGQRLLNNYYLAGGAIKTNASENMQPTTNANAVDVMEIIPGWSTTNAFVRWNRDLQPREAITAFSLSNNMTLWLVADDLTGLADNSQLGLWTNRMAGRMGMTNAATAVIKSNAVVNGHAAVFFDGTGYLRSEGPTNWVQYVGAESATVFFVMRQRSADSQNGLMQWISSGESLSIFATYDDVFYWEVPNNGAGGSVSGPQPVGWDNVFHVVEFVRGNDTGEILVDGASVGSGTPSANFTVGDDGVHWNLGALNGGGTPFTGDIAEVRVYNDAKSASERTTIRNALKATYNTP